MTVTAKCSKRFYTYIQLPPPIYLLTANYVGYWCSLIIETGTNCSVENGMKREIRRQPKFEFSSAAILYFEHEIFDPSVVWAVAWQSFMPNLVRIGQTVRKLLRFLWNSKWRPAAILDYEFPVLCTAGLFPVKSRCQEPNLVRIGWTVLKLLRFKSISGFVGGHIGFCRITFLTPPVSRRCQDETPCQIWWESDKRFESY